MFKDIYFRMWLVNSFMYGYNIVEYQNCASKSKETIKKIVIGINATEINPVFYYKEWWSKK